MPCVFCGATDAMSVEHVCPKWVRPVLAAEGAGTGTHERTLLRADGEQTASYRAGPATATRRSVCAGCNNGWMSQLEDRAKPYLLSMIRGHTRTYHRTGQTLIAAWAVKTALVAGSKQDPPTPPAFYRDFYDAKRPSDSTRVWLAATPWLGRHSIDHRTLRVGRIGEPPVTSRNAFATLLTLGHLAIYVVAWGANEPDLQPLDAFERSLLPLWPISSAVTWPPTGPRLDLRQQDRLAEIFGTTLT